MFRIIFGVFILLHGLVHLLYFGQSARYFKLQPKMLWPDGSWAFSRLFGDKTTRNLGSIFLILSAIGFVAGGTGILMSHPWGRSAVIGTAAFSAVIFILLWDGIPQSLANKGGIGLLINLTILTGLLVLR